MFDCVFICYVPPQITPLVVDLFFKVHYYCGPIVKESGYYERIPWFSKTDCTQICIIELCMFTMKA